MLLQMIDQLNAQRIPGEKTLDLDEKMHGFAQTLLETQPVVFRRGRGDSRMRDAIHAVLGMHRVYRRHCRVFRFCNFFFYINSYRYFVNALSRWKYFDRYLVEDLEDASYAELPSR